MIIPVKQPVTLLELLLAEFGSASKTTVKKIISHGNIRINDLVERNSSTKVTPDDRVEYIKERPVGKEDAAPFPVLYEDRDILVTVKPPGLLIYGDRGTGGTSLYKILSDFVKEKSEEKERLFVVHRLDREVSGIVLFAKRERVQQELKNHWNQVTKKYYALVEGKPSRKSGTIRTYLAEDSKQRVRSVKDQEGGKLAITHYKVLKDLPAHTLLEITLETGRKNQIRVHLSEMGLPVVGDRRYGADATFIRRIRLHASFLAFQHPETKARLEYSQSIPKGFLSLKEGDEKY